MYLSSIIYSYMYDKSLGFSMKKNPYWYSVLISHSLVSKLKCLSSCWSYFLTSYSSTLPSSPSLPLSSLYLLLSPLPFLTVWWSGDVYGEAWQLDRWLSLRQMSISTHLDNSDSLTMNVSMSKHEARRRIYMHTHSVTTQWSRTTASGETGKHEH